MHNEQKLVDAMKQVLTDEQQPLELWRVAEAANVSENEVVSALFSTMHSGVVVTFRYPPLPCAAVVAIADRYSAPTAQVAEGE